MKEYRTRDGYSVRTIGRDKGIFENKNGEPFFNWNGRRVYLDTVLRLTYPIMYEDQDGKLGAIGGYIGISNCYGILVEVTCDGEAVQLWEEV